MGHVEQLVSERLPPDRASVVGAFAHAYLRRLDGAQDDQPDDEARYHEVLGAFELAGARNGAPAAVRAFNPTLEENGYQPAGSVVETSTPDIPFLVDSVSEELLARGVRADVRRVVEAFPAMRERLLAMASELAPAGEARYEADDVEEDIAFLLW